jgi:hypothetical protein
MLTDDELQSRIKKFSGDLTDIREVLGESSSAPTGDVRLLPYLEALLEDRRPCCLGTDSRYIYFGELRSLAAEAVSAERQEIGLTDHVILHGLTKPLNHQGISILAKEAGIDDKDNDTLVTLGQLIEMGRVPTSDRIFPFPARLRKKKE